MLKARHTRFGNAVMGLYIALALKKHFRGMQICHKPETVPKGPVLLLANHFSWWDGFTHFKLNQLYFQKRFHLMMQEDELAKRPFFRQAGVFSIPKGSRAVFESLDYTLELLNDPGNLVVMFPQGRINSIHQQDFYFEKGITYLLKKLPANATVLFSMFLPEYGAHPKPVLNNYLYEMPHGAGANLEALEDAFTQQYNKAVAHQINLME